MTNNPNRALIELRDVSLEYHLHLDRTYTLKEYVVNALTRRSYTDKKKDTLLALDKLNLSIHEGERVGIIGFNGAGKSTLLKVISGILRPSGGQLKVHGNVQPLIEVGAGFNPEFSGRENIYFNSYMLGFNREQVDAKYKEILEFSELGEFIDMPVKYYSSGMLVRLAFTIATSVNPEILVLDEMLAAGDAAFVEKAKRRMQNLLDQAKGLVMVSHDIGLIESLCTRVLILNRGKILAMGNPKETVNEYRRLAGLDPSPTMNC